MRIVNSGNPLIIYVDKKNIVIDLSNKVEIEQYIKDLVVEINQKYEIKITGSYVADIYENKCFGLIIEMYKKQKLDFFPDLIDMKLNVHYDSIIYLEFDDYFLISKYLNVYTFNNKYYLNIKEVKKKEQILYTEFSNLIYGKLFENIKDKLVLLEKN